MFYYVIIVSFWILYTKHTGVLALKTVLKVFKQKMHWLSPHYSKSFLNMFYAGSKEPPE